MSLSQNNQGDLFIVNLEQTKRIYEMEKQLEFWKEKVSTIRCKRPLIWWRVANRGYLEFNLPNFAIFVISTILFADLVMDFYIKPCRKVFLSTTRFLNNLNHTNSLYF